MFFIFQKKKKSIIPIYMDQDHDHEEITEALIHACHLALM